jgi:MraZ protein
LLSITGTYECKIDTKGRFLFPSGLKSQLEKVVDNGFVVKRSVFQQCLELYPMPTWEKESERIGQLNRFKKVNVDFIRKFMAGVRMVELDNAGRCLIPRDLIKFGGISRELVLASVVNRVEIWDKEAYEKVVSYDPDEFADLAETVMGEPETE